MSKMPWIHPARLFGLPISPPGVRSQGSRGLPGLLAGVGVLFLCAALGGSHKVSSCPVLHETPYEPRAPRPGAVAALLTGLVKDAPEALLQRVPASMASTPDSAHDFCWMAR